MNLPSEHAVKETFRERLTRRVLEHLKRNTEARGLSLEENGKEIMKIGECEGQAAHSVEFEGYTLLLYKTGGAISSKDFSLIKSARELLRLTFPSIREITKLDQNNEKKVLSHAGGIPLNRWIDSLMGLLNTLSLRSDLLKHYEEILKLNEAILLANDLSSVLQTITDTAKVVVNAEGASLLLVDHETGELFFNVIAGENKDNLKEIRIPGGKGIAGDVVLKGKAELIEDVPSDPRAFQNVDNLLQKKTRDMIAVPIMARGSVVGVFEVINSSSGFKEEDKEFLSNIGLHTGLLLENARSREDLIRSNRELDLKNSELTSLYEIGRSLKTSLEIDQLKDEFLRSIMRMLKLGYACLMEKSGENKGLKRSLACEMTSTGPVKLEAADAAEDLTGTTDIIAWMIENHEPFFFSGGENEAAGPIRRLQELNPEYFNSKCKPDIWIPIFSEDAKDIIYVLSISGISERSQKGRYNRAFFGSLMDQVQMAFYNAKIYREALEAKEKEESIRQSFQKYVPVKVVEEILNQSENPQLKTLNTTTMFLDIRNFTGISESIEPKELVELLNEFFEEMVDAVMIHNGTVDKFIGDAIMALFGVPDASEHDADNAILSAQEIFNRLSILNKKRLSENRIIFEVSMGIHTGPVVAGNVGSRKRMDYTVIGDAVNLASRIQKMYYLYKTPVIFTEDTLNMLKGEYSVREIDLIQVRGRTHSNKIYQLAENSMIADKFLEVHNVWINAIHEYRNKNIKEAQLLFQKSRTVYPEDPVCELYLKRCSRLLENPPDLSFDGIFKVDS